MSTLLSLLAFVLFVAFILGLIKPSLVRMPTRKRSCAIYLGGFLALCAVNAIIQPADSRQSVAKDAVKPKKTEAAQPAFKYADMTLDEFRKARKDKRHTIINAYMALNPVAAGYTEAFYACVSQHTYTTQPETTLGVVSGWCFNEYQNNPALLQKRINFDTFLDNFSGWNGAYRPLETLIKASMHDDSSYKHLSTLYRLVLTDDPHATVQTTFRGTNAFGGVVKETVSARVDLRTGNVISIDEN